MPQLYNPTPLGTVAGALGGILAGPLVGTFVATTLALLLLTASLNAYSQDADAQESGSNANPALSEAESCQTLYSPGSPALFDFVGTRGRVSFADYAGYTIGNISYHVLPIFNEDDPDENNWLFRTANWLHIDTKEKTIAKQMIIVTGETLDPLTLNENERILRANDYLIDAMILPQKICGNRLDLLVIVRDIWTFSPTASASRSGGDDSSGAGLSEKKLLGSGQRVSIGYFQDSDGNCTTVSYRKPLLAHRLS